MEDFRRETELRTEAQRKEEIQKLREELAEALDQMEDEFSLQRIDELTEQLEQLESYRKEFDLEKAEEEFFREYFPLAEEQAGREQNIAHSGKRMKKMKAVIVAAALILCLNGVTMVFAGMNVFDALFRWNHETLQIGMANPSIAIEKDHIISTDGTTWTELEDGFGGEIPVIGCFIEEEMEITRMEKMRADMANIRFSDGSKEYIYTIQELKYGNENRILEKMEEEPVGLHENGIEYYFIENIEWMSIVWQYENQVYIIMGEFDKEQAKTIVRSIQYEEGLY